MSQEQKPMTAKEMIDVHKFFNGEEYLIREEIATKALSIQDQESRKDEREKIILALRIEASAMHNDFGVALSEQIEGLRHAINIINVTK